MISFVFSVAVAGNGEMLEPFVKMLKQKNPTVVIYDRNAEAKRAASDERVPQVADVEAIFAPSGSKESATIRAFGRHRYFSYVPEENPPGSIGYQLLLQKMISAVQQLIEPPKPFVPPPEPEGEALAEAAGVENVEAVDQIEGVGGHQISK